MDITPIAIIIVVGALALFGSTKIPAIARALGRAKGEYKMGELEGKKALDEAAAAVRP